MPYTTRPGHQLSTDDRQARIALAMLTEPGDRETAQLIEAFGAPDAFGRAVAGHAVSAGLAAAVHTRLTEAQLRRPSGGDTAAVARIAATLTDHAQQRAAGLGARIVTRADAEWPSRLDDLARTGLADICPPTALWVRGPLQLADTVAHSVAIVGAQTATGYGVFVAATLGLGLAEQGWTVVSSGRPGVDVSAHRGALDGAGATVAVVASGLDQPRANPAVMDQIGAEGLLVTDVPPGTRTAFRHRRSRNRILAALSGGTVLVEAGPRSAARTVITAARQLRRTVMTVPGPVTSPMSAGCHQELRRPGTTLVTGAGDIIDAVSRAGAAPASPGLAGQTVYLLTWDQGDGTESYVCADAAAAERRRDALIREHWNLVNWYDGVPAEPPNDPDAALAIWEATNVENADAFVGLFTIDAVRVAR
ncbi:DNA-processing protein DprA [Dactylosporangium sp. CS-047395]|uniref:DNA-processing protein DprA n=1 Tax=Dactylosporangium sp. CS-047395 TaxID=3239936 RepID=UPI003D90613C